MEQKNNSPFLAFTRICLNNWHYISRKILSLNKEINFFTGHSGSGKSTVIDALQLVLYANTDGRGPTKQNFFSFLFYFSFICSNTSEANPVIILY